MFSGGKSNREQLEGRFWITPNRTSGQVSEIGKWKEVHQNVREPRHIAETRMK